MVNLYCQKYLIQQMYVTLLSCMRMESACITFRGVLRTSYIRYQFTNRDQEVDYGFSFAHLS